MFSLIGYVMSSMFTWTTRRRVFFGPDEMFVGKLGVHVLKKVKKRSNIAKQRKCVYLGFTIKERRKVDHRGEWVFRNHSRSDLALGTWRRSQRWRYARCTGFCYCFCGWIIQILSSYWATFSLRKSNCSWWDDCSGWFSSDEARSYRLCQVFSACLLLCFDRRSEKNELVL